MKNTPAKKAIKLLTILLLCFAILPLAVLAAGTPGSVTSSYPELYMTAGILGMITLAFLIAAIRQRRSL